MPQSHLKGACLCGALSFEAELPSLWCGHCHCHMCQQYHGAGVVTWVGVSAEHFRLNGDADALAWYRSSPPAQRGFCRSCGSSVLFQSEKWPGEMHIALACINTPIDREPEGHGHCDSQVPWLHLADKLPRKP